MPNKKILCAFTDFNHNKDRKRLNTYGGVGYYRTIKPSEQIKGHEVRVVGKDIAHFGDTLEETYDNIFKEYDVLWTTHFADDITGACAIFYAQKHGKKFIMDLDDNYLDLPVSNKHSDMFKPGKRTRAMLSTILSFADAITVSTEPLKERLQQHFRETHGFEKPIFVIPNMNDAADWQFPVVKKDPKKFTIGYSGSHSHQDDLKMILPAIKQLMEKHKHVYFETLGLMTEDEARKYFKGWTKDALDRCALLPSSSTFKEFPWWLSQQKWDIGIAPLVDSAFTRCKSPIKFFEYSMYKIPTVASRVYPYFMESAGKQVITEDTGYLVKPKDWFKTLDEIVLNPEKAIQKGENAFQHVSQDWQYSNGPIADTIEQMLANISVNAK